MLATFIPKAGIYAHPIFHEEGNYPQVVIERVANRSALEGFERSRLPEFTKEEINYIKGTSDYFGLNHYTSRIAQDIEEAEIGDPSLAADKKASAYALSTWESGATWLNVCTHYNNSPQIF